MVSFAKSNYKASYSEINLHYFFPICKKIKEATFENKKVGIFALIYENTYTDSSKFVKISWLVILNIRVLC